MLYFPPYYATITEKIYAEKEDMRKILQIVFCILAVLSVASIFFLGAFLGLVYALIGVAAAILFVCLMLVCKNSRSSEEPHADFMNTDEENDHLNGKK